MYSLKDLLDTIPTNGCPDREEAKRDLSSAISMDSRKVIENFINCWIDARYANPHNSIQADKHYRAFILEFWEIYDERD